MPDFSIDASQMDANGNIIADSMHIGEGESFTFRLYNPVGYIERGFEIQDITAEAVEARVISDTGDVAVFPPGPVAIEPLDRNEGSFPEIQYEISYTQDAITITGTMVEDFYLGSYSVDVFISAGIDYQFREWSNDQWVDRSYTSSSGFHGAFRFIIDDNDVWGSQELEDAFLARYSEIENLTRANDQLIDAMGGIQAALEDQTAILNATELNATLSVFALAASGYAGLLAKAGYRAAATAIGASGTGASLYSLTQEPDALTVAGTMAGYSNQTNQLIADNVDLPPGQVAYIRTFAALATVADVLLTGRSLLQHNSAVEATALLRDAFEQLSETQRDAFDALNNANSEISTFLTYYLQGVDNGQHTPTASQASEVTSITQTGTAGSNLMAGFSASDNLSGGGGNDSLTGSSGNDTLDGGSGFDTILGGDDNDWVSGGDGFDLLGGGDGADTLIGGAGDDTITGGDTEADLRDIVYGGAGNDNIDGGYGNDELRGDAGNDSIAGGFGADTVIGGEGNDTLTGSSYGDEIFGSEGIDFINGGFGHDRVNGGADGDQFFHIGIFDHGSDWIQDYSAAEGDVLMWGGAAATVGDFQINTADTANAGVDGVSESFIIYRPTGQIMWALVDGEAQNQINLQISGDVFDILV